MIQARQCSLVSFKFFSFFPSLGRTCLQKKRKVYAYELCMTEHDSYHSYSTRAERDAKEGISLMLVESACLYKTREHEDDKLILSRPHIKHIQPPFFCLLLLTAHNIVKSYTELAHPTYGVFIAFSLTRSHRARCSLLNLRLMKSIGRTSSTNRNFPRLLITVRER